MKSRERKERELTGHFKMPLKRFLQEYTKLGRLREMPDAPSFTLVQLENITSDFENQISDRATLRRNILRTLSLDFEESSPFKERINKFITANVEHYKQVKVILEFDAEEPEDVRRPSILGRETDNSDTLDSAFLTTRVVVDESKKPVFCYWACLNPEHRVFADKQGDAGFVYKIKNVTIGDSRLPEKLWGGYGAGGFYRRYVGEIYVLDPEIRPNTPRDNFEMSPAKARLEKLVKKEFADLQRNAHEDQQRYSAKNQIQESLQAVEKVEALTQSSLFQDRDADPETPISSPISPGAMVGSLRLDAVKTSSNLDREIEKLEKLKLRQPKYVNKHEVDGLLKRARSLQEEILLQSSSSKKSKPPRSKRQPNSGIQPEPWQNVSPLIESQIDLSNPERTLLGTVESVGWDIAPEIGSLIDAIDKSLLELLGRDSQIYQRLLDTVAMRLNVERGEVI